MKKPYYKVHYGEDLPVCKQMRSLYNKMIVTLDKTKVTCSKCQIYMEK